MKWILISGGLFLFILASLFLWLKYGSLGQLEVGQLKIGDQTIGVEIADMTLSLGSSQTISVEIANTMLSRERGLSGRDRLLLGHGMLFVFPVAARYPFWMKDMKFPLDILWLKGGQVVGVTAQVYPEPGVPLRKLKVYYPPQAVDKVLEVPAGSAALYGWHAGNVVAFPPSRVK